jgi:hypothetical protein
VGYTDKLVIAEATRRTEKRLARVVIRQTIKDLGGGDYPSLITARRYIRSATFSMDRENAGYPPELLDTLKGMVLLSRAERNFLSRQILKMLHENWEKKTLKKTPDKRG